MNNLTVAGLIYDIAGVCILAFALVSTRVRHLYFLANAYYGGNKTLFKALLLQRSDACFGLVFLVMGFVLLLAGASEPIWPRMPWWLLLLPLVIGLVAFLLVRFWNARRSDALFDKLSQEESTSSQ